MSFQDAAGEITQVSNPSLAAWRSWAQANGLSVKDDQGVPYVEIHASDG